MKNIICIDGSHYNIEKLAWVHDDCVRSRRICLYTECDINVWQRLVVMAGLEDEGSAIMRTERLAIFQDLVRKMFNLDIPSPTI